MAVCNGVFNSVYLNNKGFQEQLDTVDDYNRDEFQIKLLQKQREGMARNAAIHLFNFGKSPDLLRGRQGLLAKADPEHNLFDHECVDRAWDMLKKRYTNESWKAFRHGISHQAEFRLSKQDRGKHRVPNFSLELVGSFINVNTVIFYDDFTEFSEILNGVELLVMYKNCLHKLVLSSDEVEFIINVRDEVAGLWNVTTL